jgi:hypothetical protein
MPKTSASIAQDVRTGVAGGYRATLAEYFISVEKHAVDFDLSPMFKGLPGDACDCEHWGHVLAGTITYKRANGDEVFSAGDVFYVAPGHTHVLTKGGEMVEFSRAADHQKVHDMFARNMEQAGQDVGNGTSSWVPRA